MASGARVIVALLHARTELFGPVAQIIKVKGDLEALSVANDTEYGLSSAVFSGDRERALQLARGLLVGMTHINDSSVNDKPNVPFGGEKNSGIGRFGGEWVIEEFTTDHWVTVQHSPRRYPFQRERFSATITRMARDGQAICCYCWIECCRAIRVIRG